LIPKKLDQIQIYPFVNLFLQENGSFSLSELRYGYLPTSDSH
jgi:hypothetical protein